MANHRECQFRRIGQIMPNPWDTLRYQPVHGARIRGIAWRDDGGRREVNRPSVDLWWMDALECRLVTGGARVVK